MVQTGQRPQKSGWGLVHFAHNGSSQVPPRAWATVPQPLQVTQRCWQRSHQGCPVARESSQGAVGLGRLAACPLLCVRPHARLRNRGLVRLLTEHQSP